MYALLGRLLRHLRPPGGWALLVLTLLTLLSPVAALVEDGHDLDVLSLMVLTPLALLAGVWLARSRLTATRATVIGGGLGVALILVFSARLAPPPSLLWNDIGYAVRWLRAWAQGRPPWPWPFTATGGYLGQRFTELGTRLWWWSQSVAAGSPAQDTIVLNLVTTILAWMSSFFAAWQTYRRRAVLVGMAPAGLAVTTAAFFGGRISMFYLLVFLFCLLWLLAICSLWLERQRWDGAGTDYPDSMGQELAINLAPWVILLVILAFAFPVIRPQQVSEAFWRIAEGPWSRVERVSEQLFGPMEGGFQVGRGEGGGKNGLPRSHLLGAGPDLAEKLVMFVRTSDPAPPPPEGSERSGAGGPIRYWRGATYDVYTGQGWTNSPLEGRDAMPGEDLGSPERQRSSAGQRQTSSPELIQSFDLVNPGQSQLYAVNEPLRVDRSVETWWRAPGDLALMTGDAVRYTVISDPPEPTVADLRAAGNVVPSGISERYLALPDGIPQRVMDLAVEVVGEAETSYDRARAIEAFLRTYTYTLDLPAPPDDRDVVDYFLFDLQEGYCDYYASSMVVMARAAGVPARLASGYAPGEYDQQEDRWIVLEKDGHSWVEVYFDGIGWVEFEPTAGRPDLARPGGEALSEPSVPPLPPRSPGLRFPWMLLIVAAVLVLLVAAITLIWFRGPARQPAASGDDLVRDRHGRLLRWGARLGQPLRDGQTAREYGATLSNTLRDRGRASRWSQVRQARAEAPHEVEQLSETFTRAQYRREPIPAREGFQIHTLWIRLRRHLWRLWLAKK